MIRSFQYEVVTEASPKLAWEVFSNCRHWHAFSNIYGSMEWSGEPWVEGSRLKIEVLHPMPISVDHLITFCEPARRVGWLDHGAGITIEQWLDFERTAAGTRVVTKGEIVGGDFVRLEGKTVEDIVMDFTRTWYDNFRIVCDQLSLSNS